MLSKSGLRAGEGFFLAFSPNAWTRHAKSGFTQHAEGRRRDHARCTEWRRPLRKAIERIFP